MNAQEQRWFAGFVIGTLQNTKLTDEERLRTIAERAAELGAGELVVRQAATEPWLTIP